MLGLGAEGLPATLLSAGRAGGGGGSSAPVIYARRDTPEILIPSLATATRKQIGLSDTLQPTYTQIIAATPINYVAVACYLARRIGLTTAAGQNINQIVARQGRFVLATGAAGAEVPFAQFRFAGNAVCQVSSAGPTTVVTAMGLPIDCYMIGPIAIPAASRLSCNGAWNDNAGFDTLTANYLAVIDPTVVNIIATTKTVAQWMAGTAASDTRWTDYTNVVGGGAAWAFGAFTTLNIEGALTADADYLVTEILFNDTTTNSDMQGDLAIGAAGSEVIQARFGQPGFLATAWGTYHSPLFMPFIIHAGERLSCRIAAATINKSVPITCTLVRL